MVLRAHNNCCITARLFRYFFCLLFFLFRFDVIAAVVAFITVVVFGVSVCIFHDFSVKCSIIVAVCIVDVKEEEKKNEGGNISVKLSVMNYLCDHESIRAHHLWLWNWFFFGNFRVLQLIQFCVHLIKKFFFLFVSCRKVKCIFNEKKNTNLHNINIMT